MKMPWPRRKLAEGIRNFAADTVKLENVVKSKM